MYKVIWDADTHGVLLVNELPANTAEIVPPRPVFFEELDLLKFDHSWTYPKTDMPLLWAIDRRYYYRGVYVAEARGGNIFESPEIVLTEAGQKLTLEPVNLSAMLDKNRDALNVLENEAMDFVEDTYKKYKQKKHLHFVASFSGGKDSQVILDLVSRIIPPDEYIVIFTDTTMEIPPTYQAVEEAKRLYTQRYPGLQFYTAKNEQHSLDLWRKFGPPSRILRWCCSVYKTAPVIRLVREFYPERKRQPKIVLFEGVRAEESTRREDYQRVANAVKHLFQTNSRIIKDWNTTEVFLYLFSRKIKLNQGYRYGLTRVGCNICPFGSDWSEFIMGQKYPDLASQYMDIIREHIKELGIKEESRINEYIIQRQWKKRAGGKGVARGNNRIDFIKENPDLEVVITDYKENFLEWAKTTGEVISESHGRTIIGDIKTDKEIFGFEVEQKNEQKRQHLRIKETGRNVLFLSQIKKVLYKATYCIHCGACEVECPTGALSVTPIVQIDTKLCLHCGNCLNFSDKGCLMASSLSTPGDHTMNKKVVNFDRYSTFGMRQEWVASYFNNLDNWFANITLGTKQVDAIVAWLRDAELLEKAQKSPTTLCRVLKEKFSKDEMVVWEILWINLFYNSNIVKWYVSSIEWGSRYSGKQLIHLVQNEYPGISERTVDNAIRSLVNTFDTTPIGNRLKIGLLEKEGNTRYIRKVGIDDIHPIAIAYSLYRFAQAKGRYALTVSEFYREEQKEGPYRLFGIGRGKFEQILRWLQENKEEFVRADLAAGLDNIHLREDLTYENVLKMLI